MHQMRIVAVVPLLLAAACGGGETEQNKAAPKAATIAAGQWELASEITAFTVVDEGPAQIDTPVGTRATETVCVGDGRPPTALFSGEGYRCNYDNYYVRNGRMNVTMRCTREGLSGGVVMMADGRFEQESLEYSRDLNTALTGGGDVRLTASVTGRRTGACTTETEAGAEESNQSGGQ
jgi:hypothetical protein